MSALALALLTLCPAALSLSPGTDVLIPAAARGPGNAGSSWVTSLILHNLQATEAAVTVAWLERGEANPAPATVPLVLSGGETRVYPEALLELFGLETGSGALRVVADHPVVVSAAILNRAAGTEFGQGFDGVPVTSALLPGQSSRILGVRHGNGYRTNLYLVDALGQGSTATLTAVTGSGETLGAKTYQLGAHMPVLEPVTALGITAADDAAILVTVTSGAVIAGASRVNEDSGDPLTLAASTPAGAPGLAQCAPVTIAGMRIRMTHPIFGSDNEVFEITATSETTATVSDGFAVVDANLTYLPFGTGAIVLADVPGLNLSNVRTTFLCADETTAAVVGQGDTPFGPTSISATVEILQPGSVRAR